MGIVIGFVITANAASTSEKLDNIALEDANNKSSKSDIISEFPYVVQANIPSYEVVWDYPKLAKIVHAADNGQCMKYAEALSGIERDGDAIEWFQYVNANKPELGAVVVFDYGHVAVVIAIDYVKELVRISERNYFGKWIVNERTISMNSSDLVGYVVKSVVKPQELELKLSTF